MPYRIHPKDQYSLIFALADLLRGIPIEDQRELIDRVDKLYKEQEFGSPRYSRNAKPEDPYWFERDLITRANKLLSENKPLEAWSSCFQEHNHGHSGFVDQTRRVYFRPINDEERQVSEDLRQIIIKVAEMLIASDPPALEGGIMGDGPMSLVALVECLRLLGADVPERLLIELNRLLREYRSAHPEDYLHHQRILQQAEDRFCT